MMHPVEANGLVYNTQMRYGTVPTPTFNPTVECQTSFFNHPIYNIAPVDCFAHQSMKPTIQSVDSSVTFNSENNDFLRPVSTSSLRKRSREESVVVNPIPSQKHCQTDPPLMFLGQDLSSNVQHHNFDIDRLISNHVSVFIGFISLIT